MDDRQATEASCITNEGKTVSNVRIPIRSVCEEGTGQASAGKTQVSETQ